MSPEIAQRAFGLATEAVARFKSKHGDVATAHSLLRGALGLLGAEMHSSTNAPNHLINADDQEVSECVHNCEVLLHKAKQCIDAHDMQGAVDYLRSIIGLMGCKCSIARSGSLTPRPRDYTAAVSRFGEGALSSPVHARLPSSVEHVEHH